MAVAPRPSSDLKDKINVTASLIRKQEATAEDFQELSDLLEWFADWVDAQVQPNDFYKFHVSMEALIAAYPNGSVPDGSWAVITPDGAPQYVATMTNGVWTASANTAPIQKYASKLALPDPGVEGIIYIVEDEKLLALYYNNKYNYFGKDGNNGLSAYEVWLALGNQGTEQDFIDFLKESLEYNWNGTSLGVKKTSDAEFVYVNLIGPAGPEGPEGPQGPPGADGAQGADGDSAYQVWLDAGNVGTEQDFLNSLQGADGADGADGAQGADGDSAYQVWLDAGNVGTEQDFLNSLQGADGADGADGAQGADGDSAYQVWLDAGNVGTEQDFLDSLKGEPGQVQSVTGSAVDNTDPANPVIDLPDGGAGSNDIWGEKPTGTIDGTNKIFTVSQAYVAGKLRVFRNGIRQTITDDYTETSSTTFEFVEAPIVDGEGAEKILIDYTPQ